MKFIGVIPARYASTRFPGKPLAMLGGKTVIQRVYEQVSAVLDSAYVATDDDRIRQAVEAFGGKAVMTSPNHKSGTDRIEEAVEKIGGDFDVVINVQGDEPFIQRSQLEEIIRCFDDADTQIATLGKPFEKVQGFQAVENPNSPKIVVDNRGYALYFSRDTVCSRKGDHRMDGPLPFPEASRHLRLPHRSASPDYASASELARTG